MAEPCVLLPALLAALAIDTFLGEYPVPLHPVVWMGLGISALLRLAPGEGSWRQLVFGVVLALIVTGCSAAGAVVVLQAVQALPWLHVLAATYLLKASFALGELRRAAWRVLQPLEKGDLGAARAALGGLCSRDASQLDREQVLAGVIESLAENASDSVVAPLCWLLVGGVPAALAYRAVNTLDACIGYRGRFEALGKAAARLDDVANWLPARLTAVLLLLSGLVLGFPVREGWRILRRDGARTPSPNGGRPMAVMAGLLQVQLAKPGVYVLGDTRHAVDAESLRRAWRLVRLACWLGAGAVILILYLCCGW